MTVKKHTLDIYEVELSLATNRRDWASMRRSLPFLDRDPGALGSCTFTRWEPKGGRPVPILAFWIDRAAHEPIDLVQTCAHEATHGAGQMLHWAGHDIRGDEGADEPHAYLAGWLARWLFEGCA